MLKTPKIPTFSLIAATCWLGIHQAGAAVSYTVAGATYQQNFNTLASTGTTNTWTNDSTVAGWHAAQVVGATVTNWTTYSAGSGAAAQGVLGSLGTTAGDRALGGQNANSTSPAVSTMYYALSVTNNTGSTLQSFSLSYVGEQWRFVQNEAQDSMTFQYQIFTAGSGSITAASGWTDVASLGFAAPIVSSAGSAALDGNDAANRVAVSGGVSGITWGNGTELWLRWADSNVGSSAGTGATRSILAIDDVSFSAVIPEPSAMLLSGLGIGVVALRRRRN